MRSLWLRGLQVPVLLWAFGVSGAMAAFILILSASGYSGWHVFTLLVKGGWGTENALTESAVKAIPILLCAIAAALPARLGLLNIGGEGQLVTGAIGATWAVRVGAGLGGPWLILFMGFSAILFGLLWGLLPGILKAWTRASEVVISLLLNYVAVLILLHLIHGPWKDPGALGWAQTAEFPAAATLPVFGDTRVHFLAIVGVVCAAGLAVLMSQTRWGFSFKVIESSRRAAQYAGINYRWYYVIAFAAAGAVAALAGLGEVSVIHGKLREGISLGYGYTGFMVAWLCGHRFELLPIASLLLGGFLAGADVLQISAGLPFATINILQGLLLIAVLLVEARLRDLELGSDAGGEAR